MASVIVYLCAILTLQGEVTAGTKTCNGCGGRQSMPKGMERSLSAITHEDNPYDPFPSALFGIKKHSELTMESTTVSAECQPELRTVSLRDDSDHPETELFPQCIRIEQCGGCCGNYLTCQPVEKEKVTTKVNVMEYENRKLKRVYKRMVSRERHTKCKCKCAKKKEVCDSHKYYKAQTCSCECKNEEEEAECIKDSKEWNYRSCSCECKNKIQCSYGTYQDPRTCKCKQVPMLFLSNKEIDYSM